MKQETPHRSAAIVLLAASIFSLAGGMIFFTMKMASITDTIPKILEQAEKTVSAMEPALESVHEISTLMPEILEEIKQARQLVPVGLEESRQIRQTIGPAVNELTKTRKLVPQILQEVQIIRSQIPAILAAMEQTCNELEETRTLVPVILKEIRTTREAVPAMLRQADGIVKNAKKTGQQASEGAMTGIFTGIVKTPFSLVGGLGESLGKILTGTSTAEYNQDTRLLQPLVESLLAKGEVGDSLSSDNPANGRIGSVTLITLSTRHNKPCKTLRLEIRQGKTLLIKKMVTAVQDNTSTWDIVNE